MRRFLVITLLAVILAAATVLVWRNVKARKGGSIPSQGGKVMAVRLADLGSTYLQADPAWAADHLGPTSETLAHVGCTVCSVAMAAASLGEKIDPKILNQRMTEAQGFTADGWFVWGALAKISSGRLTAEVADVPSFAGLDAALSRGAYPIVKFVLLNGAPHWVVIVGKEGQEYLVRDPLLESAKPVPLSSRTSRVYSMRFISRKT